MICAKILVPLLIPFMAFAGGEKKFEKLGLQKGEVISVTKADKVIGIGVVVLDDNGYFKVRDIIPDTPADLQRLIHPGDQILEVLASEQSTWTDVNGLTLQQVVYLIRGPVNSIIGLRLRDANGADKEVHLVRRPLKFS